MSQLSPEELAAYDAESRQLIDQAATEADAAEAEYEEIKSQASDAKKDFDKKDEYLRKLIRERRENRGKPPQTTLLDHAEKPGGKWRELSVEALANTIGKTDHETYDICLANVDNLGELHAQMAEEFVPFGLTAAQAKAVLEAIRVIIDAEDAETAAAEKGIPEDLFKQFPIERWTRFGLTEKDVEKLHAGDIKGGGTCPIVTLGDLQTFIAPNSATPNFTRYYGDIKGIGEAGVTRIQDAELKFWEWWRDGGDKEFAEEKGIRVAAAEPAVA
jgi:hypothetical protein